MASREHSLIHPIWEGREEEFLPLCNQRESDSANLDHMAEFVVRSGTDAQQALMALVPEAYRNHPDLMANYPQVQLSGEAARSLGWGLQSSANAHVAAVAGSRRGSVPGVCFTLDKSCCRAAL